VSGGLHTETVLSVSSTGYQECHHLGYFAVWSGTQKPTVQRRELHTRPLGIQRLIQKYDAKMDFKERDR
jgi:hypothetical protein